MARSRTANGLQGLIAFIGILLGVIPLAGQLIVGEPSGPFRLLFGEPQGVGAYIVPVVVVAVAVLIIAALELWKKQNP